jgi:hypothetical protein
VLSLPAPGTPITPEPASVAQAEPAIINELSAGDQALAAGNRSLALTDWVDAWSQAAAIHDPLGLVGVAVRFGVHFGAGYQANYAFNQAIAAADYWISPSNGTGSGAALDWGTSELGACINLTGAVTSGLSGAQNAGFVSGITQASQNAYSTVLLPLEQQIAQGTPPILGGNWYVNFGSQGLSYTLNQTGGSFSGTFQWAGAPGTIVSSSGLRPLGNGWYVGNFTLHYTGNGVTYPGLVVESTDASAAMDIMFYINNSWDVFEGDRTY